MAAKKKTTKRTPKAEPFKVYMMINTDNQKTSLSELMDYANGDEPVYTSKIDAMSFADRDCVYNYLVELNIAVVKANRTEPLEDSFKVVNLK